jgi:RNA polymerase sigma-70 factor (ECF subfamily)
MNASSAVNTSDAASRAKANEADLMLIERAKDGDARAFEVLVRKYQSRVAAVITRVVHDPARVQDLTQEVFLKVYRSLHQFRGDAAFFTWLYRIAINTARNHLQSVEHDPLATDIDVDTELCPAPELHDARTPEDYLLNNEMSRLIRSAIEQLPDHMRNAVLMRDVEGLTYEQIAMKMACPIGTIRSRIFRGRHEIMQRLQRYLVDDTGPESHERASRFGRADKL